MTIDKEIQMSSNMKDRGTGMVHGDAPRNVPLKKIEEQKESVPSSPSISIEPAVGSVVLDEANTAWQRLPATVTRDSWWIAPKFDGSETWETLCSRGDIRVIYDSEA